MKNAERTTWLVSSSSKLKFPPAKLLASAPKRVGLPPRSHIACFSPPKSLMAVVCESLHGMTSHCATLTAPSTSCAKSPSGHARSLRSPPVKLTTQSSRTRKMEFCGSTNGVCVTVFHAIRRKSYLPLSRCRRPNVELRRFPPDLGRPCPQDCGLRELHWRQ